MIEVARLLTAIDIGSKYKGVINSIEMDTARDLVLTGIKKSWRCTGKIQAKGDWLHKDSIFTLEAYVQHFWRTYNNKQISRNVMTRHDIDTKWA